MIWSAAKDGDGFCLDEFCPKDGNFLHKFILDPKVLVAIDHQGDIKGAAVCGFSSLTRVPGCLYAAYFFVTKDERRKGIATALLNSVCNISQTNHCDMLFLDVLSNNQPAMEWLYKQGFVTTGSIPHSGFVLNRGLTSVLLMYKELHGRENEKGFSKV